MQFPQYFILSQNILHILTQFIILFCEFVELVISDGGLLWNLFDIDG